MINRFSLISIIVLCVYTIAISGDVKSFEEAKRLSVQQNKPILLEFYKDDCEYCSQAAQDADPISMLTIWRDIGWLVLSVYVLLFDGRPFGVERLIANRRKAHA